MKKIFLFGLSSTAFTVIGIYLLKCASSSQILGTLSLALAAGAFVLTILEGLSEIQKRCLCGNRKFLFVMLICALAVAAAVVVAIVETHPLFRICCWVFSLLCCLGYLVEAFRHEDQ